MSVTAQRRIVDFAEDGLALAQSGPGELAEGIDELIQRLHAAGLMDELLAHEWIRNEYAFDAGSTPRRRGRGCLFGWFPIGGRR